jgi:hypothetical protein
MGKTVIRIGGYNPLTSEFFMNRFRKLGFIDYNDGLIVHSSLLRLVLHD